MIDWRWALMMFGLGWFAGGWVIQWWYYGHRLIRSRHEWYSDPVIRDRYPEEAEQALHEPDSW